MRIRFQLRSRAEIKERLSWGFFKSSWTGTALIGHLAFVAAVHSPFLGMAVGWYCAWWCYENSEFGGWGRLIVGFLCWQMAYEPLLAINWVFIQLINNGGAHA